MRCTKAQPTCALQQSACEMRAVQPCSDPCDIRAPRSPCLHLPRCNAQRLPSHCATLPSLRRETPQSGDAYLFLPAQEACEMGVERFGTRARRRLERRTWPWACDAQKISTQAEKAKVSPCVRHARSRALCGQSACDASRPSSAAHGLDLQRRVRAACALTGRSARRGRPLPPPARSLHSAWPACVRHGRGQHSRVEACELLLQRKISKFEFQTENTRLVLKTSWYKMPCALKTARRMWRRKLLLLLRRRTPPPRRRRRESSKKKTVASFGERDLFFFRSPVTVRTGVKKRLKIQNHSLVD